MRDLEKFIFNLKKKSLDEALLIGIDILDEAGLICGTLVPIGEWILGDTEKIELIKNWRKNAMRMFFAQFESTFDSAFNYLKNVSIKLSDRILFIIFDKNRNLIGHVGLSNIGNNTAELDNLMRGVSGGDPRLIFNAEVCLLKWCFDNLQVNKIVAKVISYNWLVIDLHKEVGFSVEEVQPLLKVYLNGMTNHQVVDEAEANVKYSSVTMGISIDKMIGQN
jgi:RimJ/RimL family protein N-acetyltransferase